MSRWKLCGKKRKMTVMAVILTGVLVGSALTACSYQVKEPVLAEKQTAGDGEETHGGETGSGNPSFQSLIEAPERYQAKVEGDKCSLNADAEVVVPDVDTIEVYHVEKQPYSEGDYLHFKRLMEKEAEIIWGNEQAEDGRITVWSTDRLYELSFGDGKKEGSMPMLWLRNASISDGTGADFDSRDISSLTLSDREKMETEARITAKAQSLLDCLDAGNFVLKSSEWRALREHTREIGDWKFRGQYGLRLTYVRLHNGVPVSGNLPAIMGEQLPSSQYVEFLYTSDGTLLRVKDIGREVQVETGDSGRFFLPFESVAQIFEQYSKTYFDDEHHSIGILADIPEPAEMEDMLASSVTVETVMLEYRYQRQENPGEPEEGQLIPVWNFYGRVEATNRESGGKIPARPSAVTEGLLVSINAEDGTIYGD